MCYFFFSVKLTDQQNTATTNQGTVTGEKITYTKNDALFTVTKREFRIAEQFTASALTDKSLECGTNKTEQYFQDLLAQYANATGTEYDFQYKGVSQDPAVWTVRVIPNVPGYAALDGFGSDFDICAAGGDAYPMLLSKQNLLFISSCGTGFDDSSGKPHGCDLVKEFVEPTLQLQ